VEDQLRKFCVLGVARRCDSVITKNLAVLVKHPEALAQDPAGLHAAVPGNLHLEPEHLVDLGWESLSEGDEFARFQTGGATLALFSLDLLAGEANMQPSESTGRFPGFTCAVLVEEEAMVEEAIEAVREAGARMGGEVRLKTGPLDIGEVGGVCSSHHAR
jgi:hypothetical protein